MPVHDDLSHDAALHADDAVCHLGYLLVVRDHEHRGAGLDDILKNGEDLYAGLVVERGGGLVGEDEPGLFMSARAMDTRCC